MGALAFSRRAREDLIHLWVSIAQHSEMAADRVYDEIERRCQALRDNPRMGVQRPEIGEGARMLIVENWIVLHRLLGDGVEIVRIVDGRRDRQEIAWEPEPR